MRLESSQAIDDAPVREGRGLQWLGHPRISGSLAGMAAGSAFVLANRAPLPAPWATAALLAWLVLVTGAGWAVLFALRPEPASPAPSSSALRTYLANVAGMVGAMVLGSWVLRSAGEPGLQVALVTMVVGLHFVPFARAFSAPVFSVLGGLLTAAGVIGLVLGWAADPVAAPAAAMVAGLAMIATIGVDALRR